ncbi:hypothetical protein DXT99_14175 [Pontibacter diazotrophicus]|uniref:Uncharacterized protein n=1 Tax=Pontibacter diazotrophicus TaxID=1400979 RepID=A0A3D8LB65_9BACT|nr:hypothetical protein DXT99_14175 [Pontibacter diazotrophicus]
MAYYYGAGVEEEKCYAVPDSLYMITVTLVPDKDTFKYLLEKLRVNTEEDKSCFKSQHLVLLWTV